MKYKHMVILGVLLLITSCVAVEPTRLEKGLYINPAYQFSLQVPVGWETSDQLPESFIKNMPVLLQWISHIMPARWFITVLKNIMLKGTGFLFVWKESLIMLGMTLIFISMSVKKFKVRLE